MVSRRRRLFSEILEDRRLLAVVSPTTFGDELDGDTSSIAALIALPGGGGISLREAVVAANNSAGDDTINLSAGTYTLSLLGAYEDASLTGDLDITESVQVVGVIGGTVIDATGMFDRVFDVQSGAITFGLQGVAITGGLLPANAPVFQGSGGAVRTNFSNQITIEDSSFYNNRSTIEPPAGQQTRGGALQLRGDVTIERTSFTNNHATNDGGAILAEGSSTDVTIIDSSFTGNSAPSGGAIYTSADITIYSSTFTGNTTAWDYGGGGGNGSGGAIEVQSGALLTATNITVSGNISGLGGGISLWSSTADIFSSTIVDNQGTDGGGIYVSDAFTPLSVLNIKDSIIAQNTATDAGPNVSGAVLSGRNNLVGSTTGATGFGAGDTFVLDPRIGPLTDNGGPVQTHELLLGSAAIDAGSDDPPATDARGTARPFRVKGDIGAFESTAPLNQPPVAMDDSETINEDQTVTIDVLTNDTDPEGYPLTVTIIDATTIGVATVNADQTINYTPDKHESGMDSLQYQVSDGIGGTDTATVQISIMPINDAPIAVNDSFTLTDSGSVQLDVLGNDMDVDSAGFSIDSFTQPAGGAVSVDGSGVLSYQPGAGFEGIETFTYNLVDTEGLVSDFATVTVEVVLLPSVSGMLFDDIDGDGVQNAGEDPIVGVTVYADLDGDGVRDPSEPWDVTVSDGTFGIPELPVGDTLIRVEGVAGKSMTGGAMPIPSLFVSANQSLNEISIINGSVIDSFSLATLKTAGAEPLGIAFDGNFVYVYDGVVNDILVFDPYADGAGSHHVDTIELNVQSNQYYSGLAVIGTTLFALEENSNTIATIDLTTRLPGAVLDIPAANSDPTHVFLYDLWAGLGESADGTKLVVSTTDSVRLELDPTTGVITGTQTGINVNDVSAGLAGASGRLFAGRASAFGIRVFDDSGDLLRTMPTSQVVNNLAAGPSDGVGTILKLQSDQDVTGLVFGLSTAEGSITGTQFVDTNADGVMDPGEMPLAGATVFVDLNNNDWPDPTEPQTVSGSDGSYTISGVPTGPQQVRSILPNGYAPSAAYAKNDRLFVAKYAPLGSFEYPTLRIVEVDPGDGSVIRDNVSEIPFSNGFDIAYDGHRLISVDNASDLAHEFTIDGTLIETSPLGQPDGDGGFVPVNEFGATVVGDSIITVRGGINSMQVTRFDPSTNEFQFVTSVSLQPPTGVGEVPIPMPTQFTTSVGVSADGNSLELFESNGNRRLAIDLETGRSVVDESVTGYVYASESVGGRSYYAKSGGLIEIYDSTDTLVDGFSVGQTVFGLGSGSHRDNVVSVVVGTGQTIGGINHAAAGSFANISGNVATSPFGEIAQVYLDLNHDGSFVFGEPQTLTDVSGNYTFDDVLPGEYSVRQLTPADQIVRAQTDEVARLFTLSYVSPNSTINELDPLSGATINSFPAPVGPFAGMASRDGNLFVARADKLYELDSDDGTTLRTINIPYGRYYNGMAILDSIAYMHDTDTGKLQRYDLVSGQSLSAFNLHENTLYFPSSGGLSESADGSLLVISIGSDAFTLDPNTGLLVDELGPYTPGRAMAGAAGQWFEPGYFVSASPSKTISVRGANGFLIRELPIVVDGYIDAMAAETVAPSNHRVSIYGGETHAQVDFLNFPATGTVSGTQFIDGNENGVMDSGESPLEGVIVFVDANGNNWPDAGEIQTISGADGSYVLDNVPYGTALIRTLPTSGYQATVVNSADRLFATQQINNSESPTGYVLEIIEIDPQSGDVKSRTLTDVPITGAHSTAYDGRQLFIVDINLDVLYQVAIDGTLIEETPLPPAANPIHVYGPVVVGGTIYLLADGGDAPTSLYTFDPITEAFSSPKPVTKLISPTTPSGQYSLTLSESADGKSIVAFDRYSNVFTIDPATGRMTENREDFDLSSYEFASTSVGGETFVGGSGFSGFRVYGFDSTNPIDPNWTFKRTIPTYYSRQGLGGGEQNDSGIRVLVEVANPSASSDISFGYRSTLGTVSGIIVEDVDGNGVATIDDLPKIAAMVYVDANRNGFFDDGEQETLTDGSGQYTINDLEPGDHDIRVVVDAGEQSSANQTETRLFATDTSAPGDTMIREHDPITGQQLRAFPAPILNANLVGLALDANALYYTSDYALWILDPNTGVELGHVTLPTVVHSGAAVVGDHVFVLSPSNEMIHKIDPITQVLVQTFDINVINAGHPDGNFNLYGFLSESLDGTKLLAQGNGQLLTIDPNTGVVTTAPKNSSDSPGGGSADGERYLSRNGFLDVVDQNQVTIRQVPLGYNSDSIAVATVPGTRHFVHVVADTEVSNADFLVSGGLIPSDITLSTSSINENVDTTATDVLFAELSTTDASAIDSHLYELVDGDGVEDVDNHRFVIAGNGLRLRQGETLDYEVDSNFQIRIRTTDSVGQSFVKAIVLTINDLVETRGVIINNDTESLSRSRIQTLAVEFDGSVAVESDAFSLTNRTTGQSFGYSFDPPTIADGKTVVLLTVQGPELENGSLTDGNYEMQIDATKVTSLTGSGLDAGRDGTEGIDEFFGRAQVDQFYRLFGDASGDRSVGLTDFAGFRSTFGSDAGDLNFDESLDYNNDGSIGLSDFASFRASFGEGLDFDL